MTNKAASDLAHRRWQFVSEGERKEIMQEVRSHGGGRKRIYPPCPRYKAHRFNVVGRCPCGYRRKEKKL